MWLVAAANDNDSNQNNYPAVLITEKRVKAAHCFSSLLATYYVTRAFCVKEKAYCPTLFLLLKELAPAKPVRKLKVLIQYFGGTAYKPAVYQSANQGAPAYPSELP